MSQPRQLSSENKTSLQYLQRVLSDTLTNLTQAVSQSTFLQMCRVSRETCKRLRLFSRAIQVYKTIEVSSMKTFESCLKLVKILLKSTQFESYGHRLPKLDYLVRKLRDEINIDYKECQNLTVQRIQKNYNSLQFTSMEPITDSELSYLNSNKFHGLLSKLEQGQIKLRNTQCVCCAQVFIKNLEIENSNPRFAIITGIDSKHEFDFISLQRMICAVGNVGGGVIIVGASKKGRKIITRGIRFNSFVEVFQKQRMIEKAINAVQPQSVYSVERVIVKNLCDEKGNEQSSFNICFRIKFFPSSASKINYLKIDNIGYAEKYEVYKLNKSLEAQKVDFNETKNKQKYSSIYTLIMQNYKKKDSVNSHQQIQCFTPITNQSNFSTQYNHRQNECDDSSSTSSTEVDKSIYVAYKDEPKYKYPFASLFIVSSKKYDRHIQSFSVYLKKLKKSFELIKPFRSSFRGGVRSVWMMTHEENHSSFRQLFSKAEQSGCVKAGLIIMMPVYKNLQIDVGKLSMHSQKILEQRFFQRYNSLYKFSMVQIPENQSIKKQKCFHFNDTNQAIFAYLIFQFLQLRPYFVKEMYVKKKY